jgi:PAS domain S-box-containing protein
LTFDRSNVDRAPVGATCHAGPVNGAGVAEPGHERRSPDGQGNLDVAALDASFDAVVVIDPGGHVRVWNAAAEQLFGYSRAEALGRRLAELVVPVELRERHQAGLDRHRIGDGSMNVNRRVQLPALRADGSQFTVELSIMPVVEAGELVFVGWVREVAPETRWGDVDIARESELRSMGERLRTLVANLPLGVIVEDQDRNLLLANDELLQIFAMDRLEALGIAGRAVNVGAAFAYLFDEPDAFLARREEIIEQRERVLNERLESIAGSIYERSFLPIVVDGRFEGQVWLWRDVSAQVEAERSRERAFDAEVALNHTLQEQVATLAELNRLKSEFVATVSHELRTPLTAVVGFSELLMEEEGLTDEQHEYVEVIDRSAARLLRLVGDLMLLARAESGGLELEIGALDVAKLCREAAEESAPADQGRGVTMTTDIVDGPRGRGDAVRLRQVIDNLMSNARKFTPSGGTVTLRARSHGDDWIVEVADTGIGIAPEEQEHIFDRFYRASNAAHDHAPGIGLGLAVTRAIVELHGGTISLSSELGVGTTVRVALPLAGPAGS